MTNLKKGMKLEIVSIGKSFATSTAGTSFGKINFDNSISIAVPLDVLSMFPTGTKCTVMLKDQFVRKDKSKGWSATLINF